MRNFILSTSRWALPLALVLVVLGALLIQRHAQNIGRYGWETMVAPFDMTAGETVSGTFAAELSEPHEVEIEIDWSLPNDVLDRLFYVSEGLAPLDITWKVEQGDRVLAQGDCQDYLYLLEGGHYKKSKLKERLLFIPFHRESPTGTISRGVGRFEAEAGQTYKVSAVVNASTEELNVARPRLVTRIDRAFWTRTLAETQFSAYSGFLFLGLAGVAIIYAALGWWLKRRTSH